MLYQPWGETMRGQRRKVMGGMTGMLKEIKSSPRTPFALP